MQRIVPTSCMDNGDSSYKPVNENPHQNYLGGNLTFLTTATSPVHGLLDRADEPPKTLTRTSSFAAMARPTEYFVRASIEAST